MAMQFYGGQIFDTSAIIRQLRSRAPHDINAFDMIALFTWAYGKYHTPCGAKHPTAVEAIKTHIAEYEYSGKLPDYVIGLGRYMDQLGERTESALPSHV